MKLFNYNRRMSSQVTIGELTLGGDAPIRIQSMANTDTNHTANSVAQAIRIIEAGGELVRFTAQGVKEAQNLKKIRSALSATHHSTPLVADIHFQPAAADVAAQYVQKVRINPGNYVDKMKRFEQIEYTDAEYAEELQRIRNRFVPFLNICKAHHTAIRIGVNHGSLSDRIMSRYGDTPQGMVESCMEFLRICVAEKFPHAVISIKASNTVVMVETVRLLVHTMEQEQMHFPLHLGVTEAGDGEDGRIKSAVGIGTLLAEGLGDTIRVSLSEEPELEIPVARALVDYIAKRKGHLPIYGTLYNEALQPHFRRNTICVAGVGGDSLPMVFAVEADYKGAMPDFIETDNGWVTHEKEWLPVIEMECAQLTTEHIALLPKRAILMLHTTHLNPVGAWRAAIHRLMLANNKLPVVLKVESTDPLELMQLYTAADMGALCLDGLVNGICIRNRNVTPQACVDTAFGILQASRMRTTKTEYISCPGCGRTLFDLQSTIARIKAATHGQNHLKIGIMGCIVNGPGEMADADYGYVGAARGCISLYKKQQCIEKNIPEEKAVEKLIALIKANNDWSEIAP